MTPPPFEFLRCRDGMPDKLALLLAWCQENDIYIDSRLQVVHDYASSSVSVRSIANSFIEAPTIRESRVLALTLVSSGC